MAALPPHQRRDTLDIDAVFSEIQRLIDQLDPGQLLGLTEFVHQLVRLLGHTDDQQRRRIQEQVNYLRSAEVQLLRPRQGLKGSRKVYQFSTADLRDALVAVRLREHGFKTDEIRQELQRLNAQPAQPYAGPADTPPSEGLDHISRVRMHLSGRILHAVSHRLCQETLRDALLLAERVPYEVALEDNVAAEVHATGRAAVEQLLARYRSPDCWVAWCNGDGEVMTNFHADEAIARLHTRLEAWNYYLVQIRAPDHACWYNLTFGILRNEDEPALLDVRQRLREVSENMPMGELDVLAEYLHVLFEVVRNLEHRLRHVAPPRPRAYRREQLIALANAVVATNPEKWDYCAVFTPRRHDDPRMLISAHSDRLPESFQRVAQYLPGQSLPGWAWSNRMHLAINEVVDDDPRLLFQDTERPTAVAALPTWYSPPDAGARGAAAGTPNGVLYVGTRRPHGDGEPAFTELDLKVLRLFAQAAGEIIARIDLVHQHVQGLLADAALLTYSFQSPEAFRARLGEVVEQLCADGRAGRHRETSLAFFVVRIVGEDFEALRERESPVVGWLEQQVAEKLLNLLRSLAGRANLAVFRLGAGRFATVVPRAPAELERRLREGLRDELAQWGSMSMSGDVQVISWSLPFRASELTRQFDLAAEPPPAAEPIVLALERRVDSALNVLAHIFYGNQYVQGGDFERGLFEFELASLLDPENPYILRHIAECATTLGKYRDAIKAAEAAVRHDPSYPQSHLRLAEALLADGRYQEALEHCARAEAIDRGNAEVYTLQARAFALSGDPASLNQAIELYRKASRLDRPKAPQVQARYLQAIAALYRELDDYGAAVTTLLRALTLDPQNAAVRWDLLAGRQRLREQRQAQEASHELL